MSRLPSGAETYMRTITFTNIWPVTILFLTLSWNAGHNAYAADDLVCTQHRLAEIACVTFGRHGFLIVSSVATGALFALIALIALSMLGQVNAKMLKFSLFVGLTA